MLQNLGWRARLASLVLALLPAVAQAQSPAPAPLLPADVFVERAAFTNPRLSPDGRHVALGVARKGGRTQLVVLDTEKLAAKVIAAPQDADIRNIWWISDDRLVFDVGDPETLAFSDRVLGTGLYAVQRDGSEFRQLVDREQQEVRERGDVRVLSPLTAFLRPTAGRNSDDIFVVQGERNVAREIDATTLMRLNTRTGRATPFPRPGKSLAWVLDRSDVPRVTVTVEGANATLQVRDAADAPWKPAAQFNLLDAGQIRPLGFDADGNLFVLAYGGRDKQALWRYDVAAAKLDAQPLLSAPDFDIEAAVVLQQGRVVGVRYETDAAAVAWFDPVFKDLQARIDALLPGTVNVIDVPDRGDVPIVLVRAYSDTDPGRILLYRRDTGKLTAIGPTMRDIDPRQMAQRDFVRFPARDGLSIPAWVTLPRGGKGKALPLVVLPHGGPWVRGGHWAWDPWTQFLASRGYAVIEPEFRGSTGFGFEHFRKGWHQWGLAMQDDVADAARWAVKQGIADPARICIGGASYGGYATLMGLARDPDLYRCGFVFAGVTDVDLLATAGWDDGSQLFRRYGFQRLIGDPAKEADKLRAASPVFVADRIRQPLLLAYGGADRRVPLVHGSRFLDAVKKTNANAQWVEYKEEGHGFASPANHADFLRRVETFLKDQLGPK